MHWFRYSLQTKPMKGVETRERTSDPQFCGTPGITATPSARPNAISNGETASKKYPDIHQDSNATSIPATSMWYTILHSFDIPFMCCSESTFCLTKQSSQDLPCS
ncbi:hypothetical protein K0M31_013845 [Melipona bicolor]|uniref:Uncharacterized protein n=1 Tax=Melipona bicolor TaxID=60889 RepID=A0AA40G7D5_9HYME|nr:hypothetical protein K0M31_013845 [Melipona bicolor]